MALILDCEACGKRIEPSFTPQLLGDKIVGRCCAVVILSPPKGMPTFDGAEDVLASYLLSKGFKETTDIPPILDITSYGYNIQSPRLFLTHGLISRRCSAVSSWLVYGDTYNFYVALSFNRSIWWCTDRSLSKREYTWDRVADSRESLLTEWKAVEARYVESYIS